MRSIHALAALPLPLLALLPSSSASNPQPTAIRRQSPDSGAKILPDHLAFAPVNVLLPGAIPSLETRDDDDPTRRRYYEPAFGTVYDSAEDGVFRRAAEALSILERRSACPSDMNSCADIGSPNKCCQKGTYCTDVPDTDTGHVACCPEGSSCGGGVGDCPADAVSCPSNLGGGCCIAGFVCQGVGCIRASTSTKKQTSTKTKVESSTKEASSDVVTTTETTMIEGKPSTVVVTRTVTRTADSDTETETVTKEVTKSAGAPYRPNLTTSGDNEDETSTSEDSSSEESITSAPEPTQTGCPTGFYGCLATHGGGCCRTDRNCQTHDCPAPDSTTVVSDGNTVVVPATNIPDEASATCADGWFLCGKDAGPRAGCCPTGYDCGTASCFTSKESQTGSVQKELPESDNSGGRTAAAVLMGGILAFASGAFTLL